MKLSAQVIDEWPGAKLERIIGADHTDCFKVDKLTVGGELELEYDAPWYLGIVTAGGGMITARTGQPVRRGDSFFVSSRIRKLRYQSGGGSPLELYLVSHDMAKGGSLPGRAVVPETAGVAAGTRFVHENAPRPP